METVFAAIVIICFLVIYINLGMKIRKPDHDYSGDLEKEIDTAFQELVTPLKQPPQRQKAFLNTLSANFHRYPRCLYCKKK